jgi:hypothetical protein
MLRAALLVILTTCTAAFAQQDGVHVTALRDPVTKSYRRMVAGMDLFERRKAELAPGAELRFRLLPRKRDTDLRDIRLELEGKSFSTPLQVAPDHGFTLPRDAKALAEDARVSPNRRAQSMTWRTEVRSPGLAPGTLRLGDLRLECEVGLEAELISNRTALERLMDSIKGDAGYCQGPAAWYLFFAERPLFAVTLVHGERRATLPADMLYAAASEQDIRPRLAFCDCEVLLDRTYFLPLGDAGWPNDTRIEFEYLDQRAALEAPRKDDLRAALAPTATVAFDSGYEVWVYKLREEARGLPPILSEYVAAFDPAGRLVKARGAPPPALSSARILHRPGS